MHERYKSKMGNSYKTGIWAEYYAMIFLMIHGYKILKLRYKAKVGEVDIIAKKRNAIHFCEVKFRGDVSKALHAVTSKSQARIRRTAEQYLSAYNRKESLNMDLEISFDVIGITKTLKINHVKNAF